MIFISNGNLTSVDSMHLSKLSVQLFQWWWSLLWLLIDSWWVFFNSCAVFLANILQKGALFSIPNQFSIDYLVNKSFSIFIRFHGGTVTHQNGVTVKTYDFFYSLFQRWKWSRNDTVFQWKFTLHAWSRGWLQSYQHIRSSDGKTRSKILESIHQYICQQQWIIVIDSTNGKFQISIAWQT